MKRDLYFSKPLMNAAGSLGFAPDFRSLGDFGSLDSFGTFVTNPISLRPRLPTAQPTVIEYPGGFITPHGTAEPGFHAALKKYSAKWSRSDTLSSSTSWQTAPKELSKWFANRSHENVMAVELGFAPCSPPILFCSVKNIVWVELPAMFIAGGTSAVARSAFDAGRRAGNPRCSRRAVMMTDHLITGRLFDPSLFPQTLHVVRSAAKLGLPIIGAGACGQNKTPTRCSRSTRWQYKWMRRCGKIMGIGY
ncbi:MAG: hypothetical protein U0X87_08215 [Anaerolineales bacterium]